MFYQPEIMIYLWILPVLAMVILPVLWSMVRILYQTIERSRLGEVRRIVRDGFQVNGNYADGQERRGAIRIRLDGPKANISHGVVCTRTNVSDISSSGMCLNTISRKNYTEADRLKVVFRTRSRNFAMFVRPKWMKKDAKGYVMGTEIVKVPNGWEHFVNSLCHPFATEAV